MRMYNEQRYEADEFVFYGILWLLNRILARVDVGKI